ncbi:MAG: adenylate/guanylate cyclase domain-containing protein [Betaproteobacteria bacterium]
MFHFRRFQSRLIFFFLGLVSLVQIVVFATVDRTNNRYAREQIEAALELGSRTFNRLIELRTEQLSESVRILTGDFAFKTAIATGERATIGSTLENHGARVGADVMLLLSLDNTLIADTRSVAGEGLPPALMHLVRVAEQSDRAWAVISLDGQPYQMLALPVLAPVPVAWIVAGFRIDDKLAREMQQFTKLGVSFFYEPVDAPVNILASSLPPAMRAELTRIPDIFTRAKNNVEPVTLQNEEHLVLVAALRMAADTTLDVILQRSLEEELRPFLELRIAVFVLSCGGLLVSLIGAFFIARSVTRPVRALAESARRVERGEYGQDVQITQQDELGELAGAFNRMVKGLAERDRVRSLLGKVVSPAIAEKLLSRDVVLGGEEREVTVMFSDLRNFTSLSEHRSPQEVVTLLNTYFTRMGAAIEANHGVVDKYLGDGMMALFGAPVQYEDDAGNALNAALDMCDALDELNREFRARGLPELDIGIGINTALVVAGNMGSPDRLNYTVVGDGVNLAARLEGMTKRAEYETRIIATAATVMKSHRVYSVRALGEVAVRGRTEPVVIYAVQQRADPEKSVASVDARHG